MHYQFNPTCRQTSSVLAFNAANVGTVNIPLALAASADDYLQVRREDGHVSMHVGVCIWGSFRGRTVSLLTGLLEGEEHTQVPL